MIKGITVVHPVPSGDAFERLKGLFDALGFEPGKGWSDAQGRGSAHLAPVGNIELVQGLSPATPRILVEVTQIDAVREAAKKALGGDSDGSISEVAPTHWNSRLFTIEAAPGTIFGFWESDNVSHGRPVAVEGDLSAACMKLGIVVARWNSVITDRLLQGSLDALYRSGAAKADVTIVRVPGAWEVPSAARTLAESGRVDAIIALGVLLRGETPHFEAIYTEVARGIGQSQQETGVPHAFGVLTCETLEQALDRAGLKSGNKGFDAAIAAIEMVSITRKLTLASPTIPARTASRQPNASNGANAAANIGEALQPQVKGLE